MKNTLLALILSTSLYAQGNGELNSAHLDSLLLKNEFRQALNTAMELNSADYIEMINGIFYIERISTDTLKSSYYRYLEKGDDFLVQNVSENSFKAFKQFVEAFSAENYIIGVQNYKLAAFYKHQFQQEKLSILLKNVNEIKYYKAEDEYEKANILITECDSIAVVLTSNRNYTNEVYEYEKFKNAYMISQRQSKIRTDFDYDNSTDKIISAKLNISLIHNAGGSGKTIEIYDGEMKYFTGTEITYIYDYEPKLACAVDFGITFKIYKELRIGAFYNFYSYLDGKEIDFEVELFFPKVPQNSYTLNPQPTNHKINGNGVKFTVDYSFFKDYIIHPVIGIDYYYGKVSYRGPLGLLRYDHTLWFYEKAAFKDQIYSGLDASIGAEIFYGMQSDLFLDVNYQMNLFSRNVSIHEKESTFSLSFGYYIF